MTSFIRADRLYKTYQVTSDIQVHALKGVSLEVAAGDFVAIMGPSGSGKSTFMNLLGCLDVPTRGSLFLEGVEISSLSQKQLAGIRNKKIGFIFQNFNLLPRTSALDNVELPVSTQRKMPRRATAARQSAGTGGLKDKMRNFSNQLSGGEQQRVAIARALVNTPPLILADEPTGNLDTQTSGEIMEILKNLNEDDKITIVLVTHELDIAHYAKRRVNFRDGIIVSDQ